MAINWNKHREISQAICDLRRKGWTYEHISATIKAQADIEVSAEAIRKQYKKIEKQYGGINREKYDWKKPDAEIEISKEEILDSLPDDSVIQLMQERGYAVEKRGLISDAHYKVDPDRFVGDTYRFISLSDTHLGSRYQQLSFLRSVYDYAEKEGIRDIYHSGDMTEGNGKLYKGQQYEIFVHGTDAQTAYVIENYPKKDGITTYVIGGSHDYSFYKSEGYDILKNIDTAREDIEYLGFSGAYIDVMVDGKKKGISIFLCHPSGGIPYAISYRAQKISENFAPENKPDVLLMGHLHRSNFTPMYRNIATYNVPCFQAQTPYLRAKGLYPHIGFWVVELTVNDVDRKRPGIAGLKQEFKPFYVPKERDY